MLRLATRVELCVLCSNQCFANATIQLTRGSLRHLSYGEYLSEESLDKWYCHLVPLKWHAQRNLLLIFMQVSIINRRDGDV